MRNNRQFYRNVNWIRKGFQPRINTCKRKDGLIIDKEKEVPERWKEHFNELLNKDSITNETEEIPYGPRPQIEKLTRNEFDAAIIKLRTNRVPGEDDIASELITNSSKKYKDVIYELICCT